MLSSVVKEESEDGSEHFFWDSDYVVILYIIALK